MSSVRLEPAEERGGVALFRRPVITGGDFGFETVNVGVGRPDMRAADLSPSRLLLIDEAFDRSPKLTTELDSSGDAEL